MAGSRADSTGGKGSSGRSQGITRSVLQPMRLFLEGDDVVGIEGCRFFADGMMVWCEGTSDRTSGTGWRGRRV